MTKNNDIIEFTVKCKMRADWAVMFMSMLKRMQYLGAIGSSRYLAFYADGDGTFRPKFDFKDVDVPDCFKDGGFYTPPKPIKVEALYDAEFMPSKR